MKKLLKINRRDFSPSSGSPLCSSGLPGDGQRDAKPPIQISNIKLSRQPCSMECLHCNLRAYVKDGVIEKLEMQMPLTENLVLEVFFSNQMGFTPKDRILYPMKRVGEREEKLSLKESPGMKPRHHRSKN